MREIFYLKKGKQLLHGHYPEEKIRVGEKSEDTIKRELNEEIGEPVEVSNLYDVEENFFEYNGEQFHEYMFLYLAKLKEYSNLKKEKFFDGVEKKKHLKFAWFNKEELDIYNVVPIERCIKRNN